MDKSVTYRISVHGTLPSSWSDRLGGMRIHIEHDADGRVTSTLVGELRDQAALSGVLNTLYQLHLAIVRVEREMSNGETQPVTEPDQGNAELSGRAE